MAGEPGSDVFIYWGSGSAPCWRVLLALEEKGLTGYQQKLLSFSKKEHKSEEVLKLNPRGQVPATRFGDVVVNESLAAIDYIEAVNPGKGTALHPSDPATLAKVLQRKFEALNLQTKGVEQLIYPTFMGKELPQDKIQPFLDELSTWDSYLKEDGEGSFIGGKEFSMADIIAFPTLAFFVRMGFKLAPRYPNLEAYYNRTCQRASVQKTWPPHWKEGDGPKLMADI